MPKATIISRSMTIKKPPIAIPAVFFIVFCPLILVPGLDLDVIHRH